MCCDSGPGQVALPPAVDQATLTSTSVQLRWNPPADPNGVITMYNVNVEVVSTDPGAYFMGMGMGSGNRRRKRQTQLVNTNCIQGDVGLRANITISGSHTSLQLTGLCESL